jgi:tetratricopeptide (TPR) repeat protein
MKASLSYICMLALFFNISGCATKEVKELKLNSRLPKQAELLRTPFFPQELYQCGPAALATALSAVNIQVTPEELTPQVYIPSRQGSLQIEMLATARRHGAVAIKIPPRLESVLQEISTGNVVVVMQNLGLSWAPSWHYAVVIGYDLDQELIWLRSGKFKRFEMTLSAFQRTWARSEYWAFVALPPGKLPTSVSADDVVKALLAYEKNAPVAARKNAYQTAVNRWPDNFILLMGLGNSQYDEGDLRAASSTFKRTIEAHPKAPSAYNNLANVLLAQKDVKQAEMIAEKGLALVKNDEKLKSQIEQTLIEIRAFKKSKVR